MKPEQIYREKINKVLIKYFDLDEEVKLYFKMQKNKCHIWFRSKIRNA